MTCTYITTVTQAESNKELEDDLDQLEEYVNTHDKYDLYDELAKYASQPNYYESKIRLLEYVLGNEDDDDVIIYQYYHVDDDWEPSEEHVARFSKAKALFNSKLSPHLFDVGLAQVEALPAGEVKDACLQMMRDFLAKN